MELQAKARLLAFEELVAMSDLAEAANLYSKAQHTVRQWTKDRKHGSSLVKEAKKVADDLEHAKQGYTVSHSKGNVDSCERLLKFVHELIKNGGDLEAAGA